MAARSASGATQPFLQQPGAHRRDGAVEDRQQRAVAARRRAGCASAPGCGASPRRGAGSGPRRYGRSRRRWARLALSVSCRYSSRAPAAARQGWSSSKPKPASVRDAEVLNRAARAVAGSKVQSGRGGQRRGRGGRAQRFGRAGRRRVSATRHSGGREPAQLVGQALPAARRRPGTGPVDSSTQARPTVVAARRSDGRRGGWPGADRAGRPR